MIVYARTSCIDALIVSWDGGKWGSDLAGSAAGLDPKCGKRQRIIDLKLAQSGVGFFASRTVTLYRVARPGQR